MKLKKLTIHNIASIEDASIDFENGPLAEDSRFLICGPTGAGKTTLLDAITLALYGTTPRLNSAEKEFYVDPNEKFSKTKNDEAYIYDPRMLMRRGSFNAFVELFFTDKDDHFLKVIWSCSRAYNKVDGSIKVPDWILYDASNDSVICSKKTEVQATIVERIGLTFDQFCRTTLLAQGDFTKFLKSDEDQKSEILEKLTGTGIYTEISKRIHILKGEKEAVCEQIKSQLGGVKLLTDEERNEIIRQQTDLNAMIKKVSDEEQQLTKIALWFTNLNRLNSEIEQATKACELFQKSMETDSYREEESLLSDWKSTVDQREIWKERMLVNRILLEKEKEKTVLQATYQDLSASVIAMQQLIGEKRQSRQKIVDYLKAEEPKVECYRQIALIDSYHQQRIQAFQQFEHSQSVIKAKQDEEKTVQAYLNKQQLMVEQTKQSVLSKQTELVSVSQKLSSLNYADSLEKRGLAEQRLDELKTYRILVEQTSQLQGSIDEKTEIIKNLQNQLNELFQKQNEADRCEKELEQQLRKQEQIYEYQKRTCDDIVKEYRSHLVIGEICPLCGQRVESMASDEHFISLLKPIKEEVDSLNLKWKDASKKLAEVKAQYQSLQREERLKQTELSKMLEEVQQAEKAKQNHRLFTYFSLQDHALEQIDDQILKIQQYLAQLTIKLKEIGKYQSVLTNLQKEKNELDLSLRQMEKALMETEKRMTGILEQLNSEKQLLINTQKTLDEITGNLSHYLDIKAYLQQNDTYLATLKKGAKYYQLATEKLQEVETELQRLEVDWVHILQSKDIIESKYPAWKELHLQTGVLRMNLVTDWVNLQSAVSMHEATRSEAQQRYNEAIHLLNSYFSQTQSVTEERLTYLVSHSATDIENLNKVHQEKRETYVGMKKSLEMVQQNLQEHLLAQPALDENTTYTEIQKAEQEKKEQLNRAHQQLGQLLQNLEIDNQNRKRFDSIQKQLSQAVEEADRWGHLHALFGSADGKKFRNIAQSYVLEQLLVGANQYLKQFTKRYEMECQPGSLTILLRDNEVGGVIRPTSTISGGESFLISLSLALGLSSLSRASVSMDTLFIDEGFGTLDSTYLSAVMDALERLHQMGGKKIGIISHVESLKERLTTQIQVTRINNTLSKVSVVSI